MSEDTLKAYVHWISLDKEATDSQKLMAKDISALLAERDAAAAERDSAVSSLKLAYQLAKARDAKSSADVISKAVAGNCFANEVEAIKDERDAALAENAALWRVVVAVQASLDGSHEWIFSAIAELPKREGKDA